MTFSKFPCVANPRLRITPIAAAALFVNRSVVPQPYLATSSIVCFRFRSSMSQSQAQARVGNCRHPKRCVNTARALRLLIADAGVGSQGQLSSSPSISPAVDYTSACVIRLAQARRSPQIAPTLSSGHLRRTHTQNLVRLLPPTDPPRRSPNLTGIVELISHVFSDVGVLTPDGVSQYLVSMFLE